MGTSYGPGREGASAPSPLTPTLGLAGDGTHIVLWLRAAGRTTEKLLTRADAVDLARRLLNEAAACREDNACQDAAGGQAES
jgi:hypothetical protein